MNNVRPKKNLGQHFLIDENIAKKIVYSITNDKNNLIEIGAGTGVLSKYFLEKDNFKIFEIDKESVDYLKKNYKQLSSNIINQDFLNYNISSLFNNQSFNIIGNLPYNISSQIFFKILENRDIVDEVVCMIQKEVAQRISEKQGSKIYGILSVMLQAYFDIEYLFSVSEKVFSPPPKVKSAVIRLRRNNISKLECNEKLFFKIIKTAFNQRRKMLRVSLKSIVNTKFLTEKFSIKRPEQLSVEDFVELTNICDLNIKKAE